MTSARRIMPAGHGQQATLVGPVDGAPTTVGGSGRQLNPRLGSSAGQDFLTRSPNRSSSRVNGVLRSLRRGGPLPPLPLRPSSMLS